MVHGEEIGGTVKPGLGNPDRDFSVDYKAALSDAPLPPYELDPDIDLSSFRTRVGEMIARAMIRDLFRA